MLSNSANMLDSVFFVSISLCLVPKKTDNPTLLISTGFQFLHPYYPKGKEKAVEQVLEYVCMEKVKTFRMVFNG